MISHENQLRNLLHSSQVKLIPIDCNDESVTWKMNPLVAVAVDCSRCAVFRRWGASWSKKRGDWGESEESSLPFSTSSNLWHFPADQKARSLWTRDCLSSLQTFFFSPSALFCLNVVAISVMGDLKVIQTTYEDFRMLPVSILDISMTLLQVEFL